MKKPLFIKPFLMLTLFCLGLLASGQAYELTSTYYKNYFTGTQVNTADFEWWAKPDWSSPELIQDGDLQITNTAFQYSKIVDTLYTPIDISGNPVFSMDVKCDNPNDTVEYVLELQNTGDETTWGAFKFNIIGDTYRKVFIDFSTTGIDLTTINYLSFNCQETYSADNKQSVYFDNLFIGDTTSPITSTENVNNAVDEIVAYPNPLPNGESLTIDCSGNQTTPNTILIKNAIGQVVNQQTVSEKMINISADELSSGLYIIEVIGENSTSTTKLLVE